MTGLEGFSVITFTELAVVSAWPDKRDPQGRPLAKTGTGLRYYLRDVGPFAVTNPERRDGLERSLDSVILPVDTYALTQQDAETLAVQVRRALCGSGGRRPGRWRFFSQVSQLLEDGASCRVSQQFVSTQYVP